jgi:hypothetical protein
MAPAFVDKLETFFIHPMQMAPAVVDKLETFFYTPDAEGHLLRAPESDGPCSRKLETFFIHLMHRQDIAPLMLSISGGSIT